MMHTALATYICVSWFVGGYGWVNRGTFGSTFSQLVVSLSLFM